MILLHDLINRQVAISLWASNYITILHTFKSNQSNRVDNTGLTICGRKLYMGPRCTRFFFFLICVMDSIKGFSRCRGYYNILLSICCVYIDMFGWLCRATYCSVESTSMLGVSHAIQNEKKL